MHHSCHSCQGSLVFRESHISIDPNFQHSSCNQTYIIGSAIILFANYRWPAMPYDSLVNDIVPVQNWKICYFRDRIGFLFLFRRLERTLRGHVKNFMLMVRAGCKEHTCGQDRVTIFIQTTCHVTWSIRARKIILWVNEVITKYSVALGQCRCSKIILWVNEAITKYSVALGSRLSRLFIVINKFKRVGSC